MTNLLEEFQEDITHVHALCYGAGKTKKTWWMGTAAEAGYNLTILYCDREGGLNILKNLSDDALSRVRVIDIQDEVDRDVSAEFITRFCKGKPFLWDRTAKQMVQAYAKSAIRADHSYVYVNPKKLNSNDVIGFDSWKSHVESLYTRFNDEQNIDPSDAEKVEWPGYRWSAALADWQLTVLTHLPCHFIMIGHQQYYEAKKIIIEKGKGGKKIKKEITEWARTQPISTSGRHSNHVSIKFDDVFYFHVMGEQVKIETGPSENRDGGSSTMPPGSYNWRDLTFQEVAVHTGMKPNPELKYEAFRFFRPGEEIDFEELGLVAASAFKPAAPQTAAPVLQAATAAKTGNGKTFASLLKGKENG